MLIQRQPSRVYRLRSRLREAGVMFHFGVWDCVRPVGEATHRDAVLALFDEVIIAEYDAHRARVARRYEQLIATAVGDERSWLMRDARKLAESAISLDLGSARPRPLPTGGDWLAEVRRDFDHPPYELCVGAEEGNALWDDFCATTGLASRTAQIFDWIRYEWSASLLPDRLSRRSNAPLSNFFDDGWDWWGVWCLTVHDPAAGTLAAIAASATD